MNTMTKATWCREGQTVTGRYLSDGIEVTGTVIHTRVKYGGWVQHTVRLYPALKVFGTVRDTLLLDEEDLLDD